MYIDVLKRSRYRKHKKTSKKFKFKTGDYVRISNAKRTFQRDYEQKWTEEVFIIARFLRQGWPICKVTDYDKDPIEGRFYENELQKVNKSREDLWKIEKLLKISQRWRGQRGLCEVARVSK